jgi:class 3 adenylate cyclase
LAVPRVIDLRYRMQSLELPMAPKARQASIAPWSLSALRPLDRWLVVLLVPFWAISFVLHAHVAANGLLSASAIFLADARGPSAYPTVSAIMPGSEKVVADAGIHVGDEMLRIGTVDLKGMSGLRAGLALFGERHVGAPPELSFRASGVEGTTALPVAAVPVPWWWPMLFSFSFAAVGLLIILRAPASRAAQAVFPAFMAWALSWLPYPAESPAKVAATIVTFGLAMCFAGPLLLRAAMLLPESTAPRRRWVLALPWVFVIMAPVAVSAFVGFPISPAIATRLHPLLQVAVYAVLLLTLARNYRRADSVGRRQVRWVLLGFFLAIVPALVITAFVAAFPSTFFLYTVSGLGLPLIPLSFLFAIVRYNLFDVNRLISIAASYSLLTVVVLGAVLFLVPRIAGLGAEATNVNPLFVQSALSIALAAAGVPLHRRLRPAIDRVFFPERHAIESGVQLLATELPKCESPEAVLRVGGDRLSATGCDPFAIFGSVDGTFTAVYARGHAIPPAVDLSPAFQDTLLRRNRAIEVCDCIESPEIVAMLTPADHAALDALGQGVLLPVRGPGALAAVIFLGPKPSGDIYTQNELTLLSAAAQQVGSELLRFATAELLEQSRLMQRTMRRYVPGAIATQLDSGAELEEGQREVTVLFVDIRGYTTLAEGMTPAAIFATVNQHTTRISEIVQANGGTIVEFNGDGMMTVFGAPLALRDKEAAAIRSARAIVATTAVTADGSSITVGVGIATGEAYVGNVRSADRFIWTALGNTTNLAARLQALSRELESAVVIDGATAGRAGPEILGFLDRGPTNIRGRTEAVVVHTFNP